MKKNIIYIVNLLLCLCFITPQEFGLKAQDKKAFERSLKKTMELYNYSNWGVETGKVRAGVDLREILRKFDIDGVNSAETNAWLRESRKIEKIDTATYTITRNWLREKNNLLYITMVTAPSFEAAKKYLIYKYSVSNIGPQPVKTIGEQMGIKLGILCFGSRQKGGTNLSSVDFIRDNVLFMLRAEGSFLNQLERIAGEIDLQLKNSSTAARLSQLVERPTITRFACQNSIIKLGESTQLWIEIELSTENKLHYVWKTSGGGIEKKHNSMYSYSGGEAGKHTLSLTVINPLGLHDTKTLTLEVLR